MKGSLPHRLRPISQPTDFNILIFSYTPSAILKILASYCIVFDRLVLLVYIPYMGLNFRHPSDVGLGYFAHMRFTWGESVRALGMGVVMFVHGIFPPVFDKDFSAYVKKAQERIDGIT